MTTLREAAQQALEAYDKHYPLAVVMEELRIALKEEALQRLTDVHQEIEATLEQPEQEPYAEQSRRVEQETQGRMRINPVTGDVSIGSLPPQQQAEPSQWRERVVVNLVREGVNKHRARELADHFGTPPQQQAEPVAWQLIETAPKDGNAILVMRDIWPGTKSGRAEECNGHNTYVAAWWDEENNGRGAWVCYMDSVCEPQCPIQPTHWMPLPYPPSIAPPQRKPLTDEQIMSLVDAQRAKVSMDEARVGYRVARAIERAHGIKGGA